jgi:hypothetical protein
MSAVLPTGGWRYITSQVEEVIVRTLESTLKDATHWSTRSMAKEVGLTQSAVHRICPSKLVHSNPTRGPA